MVKRSSADKFVAYVNRNLGRAMLTASISKSTKVGLRRVQMFCKKIREVAPTKVTWEADSKQPRCLRYRFTRPITSSEVK
jgi:hypothetical protein